MNHFKKALIVSTIFLLIIVIVSIFLIHLYMNSDDGSYDRNLRSELEGKLDFLIVGASHSIRAFKPCVIDEKLDCNSYNLSGSQICFRDRELLLSNELRRNKIKTVIIELSFNALSRPTSDIEGEMYFVPRLDSAINRITYYIKNIDFYNWDLPYSYYISGGVSALARRIRNQNNSSHTDSSFDKGYIPNKSVDLTISHNEISELLNSKSNDSFINQDSLITLEKMIDESKQNGAQVYITVVPVSNAFIWKTENWIGFEELLKNIGKKNNVTVLDFNLLKNRYDLFDDAYSFYDDYHMSDEGASVFSEEFCKIMEKIYAELQAGITVTNNQ